VREAGRILREAGLPDFAYVGFIEGNAIGKGMVDVIVTEGFAGNIAIKAAEGTAHQFAELIRSAVGRSWLAKLGYLFARDAFRAVREAMDPRKVNGGVFLGLNGIVIKSHGGADAEGFAAAVDIGYDMVRHGLLARISATLDHYVRGTHAPSGVPS
jgi:glycerol-3-phosphate acyltransferase PlsX